MTTRKKMKLLVVDEHEDFRHLLEEMIDLSQHIYDITYRFVSSEREAKQLMKGWEPSVVLVDAHISDGNSMEVVRACQCGTTSVVVTSDEQCNDIELAARRWGAAGYMPKCSSPEEVERLLQELIAVTNPTDNRLH